MISVNNTGINTSSHNPSFKALVHVGKRTQAMIKTMPEAAKGIEEFAKKMKSVGTDDDILYILHNCNPGEAQTYGGPELENALLAYVRRGIGLIKKRGFYFNAKETPVNVECSLNLALEDLSGALKRDLDCKFYSSPVPEGLYRHM